MKDNKNVEAPDSNLQRPTSKKTWNLAPGTWNPNSSPLEPRTSYPKLLTLIILGLILTLTLSFVIADSPALSTIESMMDIIKSDYYKDVDDEVLIRGAIDGMFKVLDPHSGYYNNKEFQELQASLSGEFSGVGMQVERKNDRVTVVSPIEGTPAFKAGIATGDIILSVDGKDIKDLPLDQAVALIRGEAGTKVKLEVVKADKGDVVYIELIRQMIKLDSVKTTSIYNQTIDKYTADKRIGYIRITEFDQGTADDFKALLEKYKKEGKKGLIIDLRYNPGGLLSTVVDMCKEIIPEGPIVHIDTKGDKNDEVYSSTLKTPPFKIVVITNEGSASASEILTGAVKDSGVGKIVGTKTYGKGTVQTMGYLTNGDGVKMTIAEYLTRNKIHIDGKGIMPDVEVKPQAPEELANVKADRDLTKGIVGLDVYGIQQRLQDLGYKITTDGILDTSTIEASGKLLNKTMTKIIKEDQKAIVKKYEETKITNIVDIELKTAVDEMIKLLK